MTVTQELLKAGPEAKIAAAGPLLDRLAVIQRRLKAIQNSGETTMYDLRYFVSHMQGEAKRICFDLKLLHEAL